MPSEKLSRILDLEAEKLQDRAIMGGLSVYADTWLQESRPAYGPESQDWVQAIADALRNYSRLVHEPARREAIGALSALLAAGPTAAPDGEAHAGATTEPARDGCHSEPGPTPGPLTPVRDYAGLDSPVTALHGVGPRQARRLARLGIETIRDTLYYFPRRFDDFSKLKPIRRLELGEEVTVIGQVRSTSLRRSRSGRVVFKAVMSDGTGFVEITWFNQPYLDSVIKQGQQLFVSGKVDQYLGRLCFKSPQWETLEDELLHTGRLVPVYPLTAGIRAKWVRRLMKRTVDYWSKRLPDHLPATVREEAGLADLETAIIHAHFPDSHESLQRAQRRLAFDELFVLQIGLLCQRHEWRSAPARPVPVDEDAVQGYLAALPFKLTGAQHRVLRQILDDIRLPNPMNRLLQGDVGSGKTAVAAAAIAVTVGARGQAAIMAPTEILAEQHFNTLSRLLDGRPGSGPEIRLLTGSIQGHDRDVAYAGIADSSVSVVIGTHALIQAGVQFSNLQLAIVDEQHRFGVRQRAALRQKGYNPHLLTMTATPIPRSLELTIWGHMDVSVIDEMPPGREPVTTRLILPAERDRAYAFVRKQVEKGHQAFIIYPLVEKSGSIDAKAAVDDFERLKRDIFPDLRLGLLHGRLSSPEKESAMSQFAGGELDILVATSVVEVGIDVPNATVMLVEGADRFGLAQLHQFRGRVGRGDAKSFCLLVSETSSRESQERLRAVEATNDGFLLAQKDLEMRGPGEFLGTRQSGFPPLKLASATDVPLLEEAREAAQRFFATDPDLSHPDNRLLARRVAQLWEWDNETQ